MDICFLITTYNRQESCQRLVDSLQGLGDIVVVHDGTDYEITGARNIKFTRHLGKAGYWKTINILYKNRSKCKFYFTLPDDFSICESQITRAIEIWESIKDTKKICLNLYADRRGLRCWTNFYPIDKGDVWRTGWVDMCFLCEERFFASLGNIREIKYDWNAKPSMSSGVGAYISRKLHRLKLNMYQVKESLVTVQPEHCISQMHNKDNIYDISTHSKHTFTRGVTQAGLGKRRSLRR